MEELKKFVKETIAKYPNLKSEISDLYELCIEEIEERGSSQLEINLCRSSIQDLITEEGK